MFLAILCFLNTYHFNIFFDSHTPTRLELAHIDPFAFDNNIFSDCNIKICRADTIVTLDTNVPFVPTTIQQLLAIVDHTLSTLLLLVIPLVVVSLLNCLILFIPFIPFLLPIF